MDQTVHLMIFEGRVWFGPGQSIWDEIIGNPGSVNRTQGSGNWEKVEVPAWFLELHSGLACSVGSKTLIKWAREVCLWSEKSST